MNEAHDSSVNPDLEMLAQGRHGDPFAFLGRQEQGKGEVYRCFMPRVREAWLDNDKVFFNRVPGSDLFELPLDNLEISAHPMVIWEDENGEKHKVADPYSFDSVLDYDAMRAFQAGKNYRAQDLLGARRSIIGGFEGTLFSVWAPNAERVSVVGDFNSWDGRYHPMRFHAEFGIWELFIPGVLQSTYKFELRNRESGEVLLKADPFGLWSEQRPATANIISPASGHRWQDENWKQRRHQVNSLEQPISVYEVHLGSWQRKEDGSFLDYQSLAIKLCEHIRPLGFTHIELLPMKEHPLDESWGYQSTGYFAPTSRHGTPDDFREFVDHCHQQGIAVILDWVPAHFPRDEHALARFDGTRLFEYKDQWKAEHQDWGTLIFNYERNEVRSFLISSALYWLDEFHLDGLRVDAVASMLYLNFSRQAERWVPNKYGGHHNLEAIEFIRELNAAVKQQHPACLMIAEESSDWHGVTHTIESGGLGFTLKWNMGWMHDTLNYLSEDPIHRKHHQDWLTFGPVYAFNEHYLLPLSHDEVVHLKKSLFGRMPGDEWQQFANLRLLYCYQWFYPGKQLLFMGGEFAQTTEWNASGELPWDREKDTLARGVKQLISSLNRLQRENPALAQWDCDRRGFEWLDGDDSEYSVLSFLRHSENESLVVVFNFTPKERPGYRIPIHKPGRYQVVFNSDEKAFGGTGGAEKQTFETESKGLKGRDQSLLVDLPPLAAVVFRRDA
ncbi:MAG TPA: 1,4-alpha-glucan branching protein GlgB [Xanthomonadales bacterium]|nr:1,4-alpha-glucan branching protein GlgB [Xanthomonadales bacterium]